jgi:hypothetical protein
MDKRLKAVLDRGAKLREKMSKTEGGFLPSYEFAKLCKPQSTHRGVINRYRSGGLLACFENFLGSGSTIGAGLLSF